jgi:hypothetical protein
MKISVEDGHSRGYMALCVFPKKHSYFVIHTLLRAFRLHSKPELFHHNNGGEYDNGVISRLLPMLDIVDVPTIAAGYMPEKYLSCYSIVQFSGKPLVGITLCSVFVMYHHTICC